MSLVTPDVKKGLHKLKTVLWGEALLTSVITSASEHLSVLRSGPVALDVAGQQDMVGRQHCA